MDAKRERYTPNDVGPSPLEWAAPRLSEVSTLITNGFVGTATPFYTDSSGVPYLYGTNVRANKLEANEIRYVTHEFHTAQSKTTLKSGDLLTVQSGHIGETAVVTEQFEGANCHALIVTRLKQNLACPEYLSYYVNSEIGRARMKGLEVGSTIHHINTRDLKKFRVLLPSIPEQKKIAQILSTWDKTITITDKLLINSQQQRKALIQELLTGKRRLLNTKGVRFSEEWKQIEVRDLITQHTEKTERNNQYPVLTSSRQGLFFQKDYYNGRDVASEDTTGYNVVPFGYFTYRHMSDDLKFSFNINELCQKGIVSTLYPVFQAKEDKVIPYLLQLILNEGSQFKRFSLKQKQGGSRTYMYLSKLQGLVLELPSIEEQQKIVAVLSAADQEIVALREKLNTLKQEKKALMQQLLTGKRRVKID